MTVAAGALCGLLIDTDLPYQLVVVTAALAVALCPQSMIERRPRLVLLAGAAALLFTSGTKDDFERLAQGKVRVWNVYHYYIGAKYFPELGYTDLYRATLAADREELNYWTDTTDKVRSLTTYRVSTIENEEHRYQPSGKFSPERWNEFKEDLAALAPHRSARGWRNVFRDRGYNGTPLWTAIGRGFSALVPASSSWLYALVGLDLLLLGATGVLIWRTFGAERFILVSLLFTASPANIARLVGGFLQTDWLCAVAASVCFLARKRPVLAGTFMAYAISTRAFPLLMVACAGLTVFVQVLWKQRSLQALRRHLSFYLAVALACLAAFAVGTIGNGRGVSGWLEFQEAIAIHRDIHVIGDRRIGLEHAFTQDITNMGHKVSDRRRTELVSQQQPLFFLSALVLMVLLLTVVARSTELDGLLLGTIGVFVVFVLSRYYFGALALLPLLSVASLPRRQLVVGGQLAVFVAFYWLRGSLNDDHASYAIFNGLLAAYFTAVLAYLGLTARAEGRTPLPLDPRL